MVVYSFDTHDSRHTTDGREQFCHLNDLYVLTDTPRGIHQAKQIDQLADVCRTV